MIAAHPDDENTALLSYFSRGRKVRTGYLSLTRGEGGQNLIGSEQGDALGVIRTQELLAARRIDGAEQFFTRAIDFGFTKTTDETFAKWGREKILSDVVWVIRRFRPDVIVLRFSGTPRDGHGQHQVSAILGKEAFSAAADPARFPEQLRFVQPWQAKRIVWNVFSFTRDQEKEAEKLPNRIDIDPGDYDPVLGHSYGEIAGMSRSMHRSQGMGAPERKGSQKQFLVTVAGDPATRNLFDGIDTTWDSIPGSGVMTRLFEEADRTFDPVHPGKTVPLLLKARAIMAGLHHPVVERKRQELDEAIALFSGVWLEATADKFAAIPGGSLKFTATALARDKVAVAVESVKIEGIASAVALAERATLEWNVARTFPATIAIAQDQPWSQPYWLRDPKQGETYAVANQLDIGQPQDPPIFQAHFSVTIAGERFDLVRPVVYRYIDRVQGELTRPLIVAPAVALKTPEQALMFPTGAPRSVEIQISANVADSSGEVRLRAPAGWTVTPASQPFKLSDVGQQITAAFRVEPPSKDARGSLEATATAGGRAIAVQTEIINYPHIPVQTLFPPASTAMVRAEVRSLARTVGYVMGAGDEVPAALRQLGIDVTLLTADDLARADLGRFDAIVTGVRAYNTRPDLRANQQRLLDYMNSGGAVVVQYNVLEGGFFGGDPTLLAHIGPYPITTGRERVTVEDAPVAFPDPSSPLLHTPNEITSRDFDNWIQERGLYFASAWDPHCHALFETHDPGEKPLLGGTLYCQYGKGAYVFTAFSWFRELPAGVPGAYRIFANLLSSAKSRQP